MILVFLFELAVACAALYCLWRFVILPLVAAGRRYLDRTVPARGTDAIREARIATKVAKQRREADRIEREAVVPDPPQSSKEA